MSCANTRCQWHRRDGGGCKLFEGLAWEKCRQSVKPGAKPAEKAARTTAKTSEKKGAAK